MGAITDIRLRRSLPAALLLAAALCAIPPEPQLMLPAHAGQVLKEPWTLLTYMAVHTGIPHLAANAVCLLMFATAYGAAAGPVRTVAVFLAGGLAGALAWLAAGPEGELCGASAGVLALAAANAVRRRTRVWGIAAVAVLLLSLVASTGPECAAHIAGAAAGAVAAAIPLRRRTPSVEAVAAKMRRSGYTSLTAAERRVLTDTNKS